MKIKDGRKEKIDGGVAFVYSPKSRTSFRWVSTKKFCNQEAMYPSLSYPKIAKDLIKTVVQFFMTLSVFFYWRKPHFLESVFYGYR
jgi:hypothetical protein